MLSRAQLATIVVVGAALLVFLATRRIGLLLYPFFLMILWNPIAMQWSLGGFAASGVLMTWSILAPVGALMVHRCQPGNIDVPDRADVRLPPLDPLGGVTGLQRNEIARLQTRAPGHLAFVRCHVDGDSTLLDLDPVGDDRLVRQQGDMQDQRRPRR